MLTYCPDHIRARIISTGERLSVAILDAVLQASGLQVSLISPEKFLFTNDSSLNAVADLVLSKEKFAKQYDKLSSVALMPGFIGVNAESSSENPEVTTLGRNGSDYSAAVLAVCAEAQCCEIWTDVEGVYNADPRMIKEANLNNPHAVEELKQLYAKQKKSEAGWGILGCFGGSLLWLIGTLIVVAIVLYIVSRVMA